MSIGDLPSNKLVSLALHGYNPFQPDVGIFCGGYQGPLYPNPTTLSYPGFDPYLYTDPTASIYQMANNYNGLGVGDPGIDYKNPGHILGLLDTFSRMSYGVNFLINIYEGNNGDGIGPAVDISIPMINIDEEGESVLGSNDIYPFLCEVPADWLNGFTVEDYGAITPDPRPFVTFPTLGGGYSPSTSPIDEAALNTLFSNQTIFSYLGMPQYFRSVIDSLATIADSMTDKTELEFTLESAHIFNRYVHMPTFFDSEPEFFVEGRLTKQGKANVQYITLNSEPALKVLTGSSSYHDGEGGQNEYRSLTELNSVINIVPVQVVGATYWVNEHGVRFPSIEINDQTGRSFKVASYMIADLAINVSDVPPDPNNPEPGTVTIEGQATVKSLITDPTAYYYTETRRGLESQHGNPPLFSPGPETTTEYGSIQSLDKYVNIEMSMTNKLSWDKVWLDTGGVSDSDSYNEHVSEDNGEAGGSEPGPVGILTIDQSDLVVPFSKEFTLGAGCTSIRMRAFLRNNYFVGQRSFTAEDQWVPYDDCHEHIVISGISLILWPHCHYPAGVRYNGWLNDPDTVPDDLRVDNIELSFTVTGTNMDPIVCEVSI